MPREHEKESEEKIESIAYLGTPWLLCQNWTIKLSRKSSKIIFQRVNKNASWDSAAAMPEWNQKISSSSLIL